MTDREQTRRDEKAIGDALAIGRRRCNGHGPSRIPFVDAEYALQRILAELEQAERRARNYGQDWEREIVKREQAEREQDAKQRLYEALNDSYVRSEARLAKVPALVEALREIADEYEGYMGTGEMLREKCLAALATWEQE